MKTFSEKIGFDIESFFNDNFSLLQEYQPVLAEYYTKEGEFPKKAFDLLDQLEFNSDLIYRKIQENRYKFDNCSDFEIFDQIEDFISLYRMIENYSKWYRSSTIKGRYKQITEINYILKQNQTLEEVSNEVGWDSREEGALDLALRNQIKEQDYDLQGGLNFRFSYQNDKRLQLESVIDEMTGKNILGKDIAAKLAFQGNDVLYLSPEDTFLQTCEILSGLMKNNNPEFPTDGYDKSAISNRNLMRIRLSTFIRQMYATVAKDDTIKAFSVSDVVEEDDILKIVVQYNSYYNQEPVKVVV